MKWEKQGRILNPDRDLPFAGTHAMLPTPWLVDPETLRIYFTTLDGHLRGRVASVDVDPNNPSRIRSVDPSFCLEPGAPGTFDDAGVNASCIAAAGSDLRLYYIGWQRGNDEPYRLFTGLAVASAGDRRFRRADGPVLPPTAEEPTIRSALSLAADNGRWTGYYVSAHAWFTWNGRRYPRYGIRRASSLDGRHWQTDATACLQPAGDEFGLGRPWVVRSGSGWRLFYSIRSEHRPYRLGYADSDDGHRWERRDDLTGLDRSVDDWDAGMVCYAAVVAVGRATYLFYNGTAHGRTGFGYAVLAG